MLILSCFKCQFYWIFLHLFSDIVVFRALVWILKLDRRRINGTVSILAVIWPSNVIVVNDRSGRTQHGIAGPTLVLVLSGKLFMVSAALEESHYFSSQILLKKIQNSRPKWKPKKLYICWMYHSKTVGWSISLGFFVCVEHKHGNFEEYVSWWAFYRIWFKLWNIWLPIWFWYIDSK